MARGWESKSVEDQQAEALASTRKTEPRPRPDELARQRQREGLFLSRTRVRQQLDAAQNPAHRHMLQQALVDLEAKLARLG